MTRKMDRTTTDVEHPASSPFPVTLAVQPQGFEQIGVHHGVAKLYPTSMDLLDTMEMEPPCYSCL